MALLMLYAGAALGGEPQCAVSGIQPCIRRIGDGSFGMKAAWPGYLGYQPMGTPWAAADAEIVCKKSHYRELNHCGHNSDFRLTIVEPEEFKYSIPLVDFYHDPWVDSGHIDQNHPIHGKVMDIVPPNTGEAGCSPADWAGTNVSGHIAITNDNGARPCWSFEPMYSMQAAGEKAAAYLMSRGSAETLFEWYGPSQGIDDMPGHTASGALWYMVQEAKRAGKTLRGKIELHCPTPDMAEVPPLEYTDGCPYERVIGSDRLSICNNMPDPEDRLCSKCPLQLKRSGGKVCAYGSRLYPMLKANFFQASGNFQVPSEIDVVYIDLPPWAGCQLQDFAGVSGKVVAFSARFCMGLYGPGILNAARLAEKQGATGVIFLSNEQTYWMLSGPAFLHSIPIHTVNGRESPSVIDWFEKEGAQSGAYAKTLKIELVDEDVAPDPVLQTPPPTEAPQAAVVAADTAAFEGTPTAVVSIVLIVLLTGVVGGKIARAQGMGGGSQQVDMDGNVEKVSGLPLSVASTLLSVSTLVIVTIIGCSLSAKAAREATDAASISGKSAAGMTYDNAVGNVDRLSDQLRKQTLGQVASTVKERLNVGHATVIDTQELFNGWDGTWQGFKATASVFFRQNSNSDGNQVWHTQIKTVEGYYADSKWMTDFTSPGADDLIAANRSGYLTGLTSTWFEPHKFAAEGGAGLAQIAGPGVLWPLGTLDDSPLNRVGGEILDGVELARRIQPNHIIWRVSDEGLPWNIYEQYVMPWLSVTIVQPLYDGLGQKYRGMIASSCKLRTLSFMLSGITASEPSFENMTALIVDASGLVVAHSHWWGFFNEGLARDVDVFRGMGWTPHWQLLSVKESADAADEAQYNYMLENPVLESGSLVGEFDQRQYYSHPDLHELNIVVGSGGVGVDESPHAHPVFMRGGCGACVKQDASYGQVFEFDGDNTLYVDLNLTTDVPYVAAHRKETPDGSWDSDHPAYKRAMPLPADPTRQCIYVVTAFNYYGIDCSLRGISNFYQAPQYTLSLRVKPVTDVSPTDATQRLFQFSEEASSALTVLASGTSLVETHLGGGVALGPGLPGGVWTTVTVQVTKGPHRRDMRLFLNGTLISSGFIGLNSVMIDAPRPFAIGRGFKGQIQSVRLYKHLADPESLHSTAQYVRRVPKRRWFLEVAKFLLLGLQGEWQMSVRIPRHDVMRDVDASNARLTSNLQQHNANIEAQLERDITETMLVTVMVVLVSVLAFLVFNDLLTQPFANVSSVMCDAAVMRIDVMRIDENTSHSSPSSTRCTWRCG
eukprot:TRINITY_DN7969_c1_g1_i7.p1 TRINITY_DN7969_c1_g1~~TRINITY_DN7969_c1_g1_i7.p1  ORF type:complete len:1295 (+),score=210.68 TRINITY_DN7969_c1_g1_i7:47-3886(+)